MDITTPAPGVAPDASEATPGPADGSDNSDQQSGSEAQDRKIWKLKVDGEEIDFDATDEEAVKREVQKARASGKRFEQAAKIQRQAEQFIQQLKTNPKSVLSNPALGLDFAALAEEFLWERYQADTEASLSPEEQQRLKDARDLKKYRDDQNKAKEDADSAAQEKVLEHYRGDYEKKFISALEEQAIPKTAFTVARMAQYQAMAIDKGYELEMSDLAALVKADYLKDIKALFGASDGDTVLQMLGDETADKMRKSDLAKHRAGQSRPARPGAAAAPRQEDAPRKALDRADFMKQMKKDFGGR